MNNKAKEIVIKILVNCAVYYWINNKPKNTTVLDPKFVYLSIFVINDSDMIKLEVERENYGISMKHSNIYSVCSIFEDFNNNKFKDLLLWDNSKSVL